MSIDWIIWPIDVGYGGFIKVILAPNVNGFKWINSHPLCLPHFSQKNRSINCFFLLFCRFCIFCCPKIIKRSWRRRWPKLPNQHTPTPIHHTHDTMNRQNLKELCCLTRRFSFVFTTTRRRRWKSDRLVPLASLSSGREVHRNKWDCVMNALQYHSVPT